MFVIPYTTRPRHLAAPAFGRSLDRLFDESFERALGKTADASSSRSPAMDVSESDTAFTIAFDVPGVDRQQLKVSVEGRRVTLETVEAAVAQAAEPKEGDAAPATVPAPARVLYRERSAARYARTVSLPAEVDQATSQAKFDNGVLTLTLAKRVPAGATQLSIG